MRISTKVQDVKKCRHTFFNFLFCIPQKLKFLQESNIMFYLYVMMRLSLSHMV